MREEPCPDPLANPFDRAVPEPPRPGSRWRRALAMTAVAAAVAAGVTGGIAAAAPGDDGRSLYTYTYQLQEGGPIFSTVDLTALQCDGNVAYGLNEGHINGTCTPQGPVPPTPDPFAHYIHVPDGDGGFSTYAFDSREACEAALPEFPEGSTCTENPNPPDIVRPTPGPVAHYIHVAYDGGFRTYAFDSRKACEAALPEFPEGSICTENPDPPDGVRPIRPTPPVLTDPAVIDPRDPGDRTEALCLDDDGIEIDCASLGDTTPGPRTTYWLYHTNAAGVYQEDGPIKTEQECLDQAAELIADGFLDAACGVYVEDGTEA